MNIDARRRSRWLGTAAVVLIATIGTAFAAAPESDAPANGWRDARQLVLVVIPGWDTNHGTMRTFSREHGAWQPHTAATPVVIGKAGAGWGIGLHPPQSSGPHKREGDGRSAAGVFHIGPVFGYAGHADTAMPYQAMQRTDFCVDVPESPLYNRIVDTRKVGEKAVKGATEPMRRDLAFDGDQRYRLGFVIDHNPDGKPGAGSCIFGHLWKSPSSPTTGCTAMPDTVMERLVAWLKPDDDPIFVLLPQREYARLYASWKLPAPEAQ